MDIRQFLSQHQRLTGELDAAQLPRLIDVVCAPSPLAYGVAAVDGPQPGVSGLSFSLSGTVYVQCQRCLETMPWQCQIDTELAILPSDAALERFEQHHPDSDAMSLTGEFDPLYWLEEELLLALPPFPRHAEACTTRPAP